jgi:ribosomal protein S18 acetylase RimI-like enzyme
MNKTEPIIRKLRFDDYPYLEDFLYEAIYVHEGDVIPDKSIIFYPKLYSYVKDFGQEHDLGFIIEANYKPVGAIWTRLFSEEERGYGFVDNQTPELSMAINSNFRNQGFGRKLLEKMFLKLHESGYKKVSLSVDKRNFAYQLYQKFGFQEHQIEGNTVVMVKNLVRKQLDYYELLALGTKIKYSEGTEVEISKMMEDFDKSVPRPNGSNLFFYPENYKAKIDDISSYDPTVEEVVEQCLSYKVIEL